MKFDNAIYVEKISIEKIGDKLWVLVRFNNNTIWIPALMEQALIAQYVVNCEKAKYPNVSDPARMPKEFLSRAIKGENVYLLASIFNLTHTNSFRKFCLEKNRENS